MIYQLLFLLCFGHHPGYGYHNYAPYGGYYGPSFWYYFYVPGTSTGTGIHRPPVVDDTLANISFRLQQLSHLAARTSDPELRKQYLNAKREVELERLGYLRGQGQRTSSAWPGYGYLRPGE